MKKFLLTLALTACVLGMTACGNKEAENPVAITQQEAVEIAGNVSLGLNEGALAGDVSQAVKELNAEVDGAGDVFEDSINMWAGALEEIGTYEGIVAESVVIEGTADEFTISYEVIGSIRNADVVPSRSTGIYISGGVMAAPTVGTVMADILPYLGTKRNYTQEDAAGRTVIVEDMKDLTAKEAAALLKEQGLEYKSIGDGETVTAQIPAAGQAVPADSQLILYFGEGRETETVTVPDFTGMTRQQASDAAGLLGIYILVKGNPDLSPSVTVVTQSVAAETAVERGATIELVFADTKAAD